MAMNFDVSFGSAIERRGDGDVRLSPAIAISHRNARVFLPVP